MAGRPRPLLGSDRSVFIEGPACPRAHRVLVTVAAPIRNRLSPFFRFVNPDSGARVTNRTPPGRSVLGNRGGLDPGDTPLPPILRGAVSTQYVFTTSRLSRRFPPDRQVLEGISLSFLPGAKIGVLGYNGAGKSTLLRIMAGLDADYDGQAQLAS